MRFEQNKHAGSARADLPVLVSRARRAVLCVAMLLPAVLVWGCSGVVSGYNSPPPPQTYSLAGTISPAAGGNGATVTLSGAASATTTANSSGSYSFTGLANGTYTITPSHMGYAFNPTTLTATVNGANFTGMNFTATAQTFSISGTISPAAGGSGSMVTLSGTTTATTTADGAGNYTFTGLANGTYAVTPSRAGYTFNPSSQAVTVNGANVTGLNFTATPQGGPTFSISGAITPIAGGSGATVTLTGPFPATTVTNTSGNYTFTGLANGTYTVTPTNTGYSFTPASQNVTINATNATGVNFTATVQLPHSVALAWIASTTSTVTGYNVYRSTLSGSSYTLINSSPVLAPVVTYTDTTVQNATTYYYVTTAVDASGAESVYSNEVPAVIP